MSTLTKFLTSMKSDLRRKEADSKVLREQIAEMQKAIQTQPAVAKPASPPKRSKAKATNPGGELRQTL